MVGRNSIVTVDVVAKLSEAFRLGFSDTDACHYAEIDRSTYYRHLESDVDFATQMASAKNYAKLKCCSVLLGAIEEGNIQVCQWWLERRYKDQFGRQIQVNSVEEKEKSRAIFEEIRRKFTFDASPGKVKDGVVQSAAYQTTDNNCSDDEHVVGTDLLLK